MKDMLITAAFFLVITFGISLGFLAISTGNKKDNYLIDAQKDRSSINYQAAYDEEQVSTKAEVYMDILASDVQVKIDGVVVPVLKEKNGNVNNLAQIKNMIRHSEYYKYYEYDSFGNLISLYFVAR